MVTAYDRESNTLEIKDKYKNHYRLQLRGNRTLIKGNSGTGKTFLCSLIEGIQKGLIQSEYDVSNIMVLNRLNISSLWKAKDKLIMIDRAEYLLSEEDVLKINSDTFNRYLIYSRVPLGIETSPNHQGDLFDDGGVTIIKYRFDVKERT